MKIKADSWSAKVLTGFLDNFYGQIFVRTLLLLRILVEKFSREYTDKNKFTYFKNFPA